MSAGVLGESALPGFCGLNYAMAAPTPVGVETRPTGGWLTWDFGLEGGVAELHGFEDDVFDGAACRNHGENVLGVGNHDIEYVGGFGGE